MLSIIFGHALAIMKRSPALNDAEFQQFVHDLRQTRWEKISLGCSITRHRLIVHQ
jgi:hypothetical protein